MCGLSEPCCKCYAMKLFPFFSLLFPETLARINFITVMMISKWECRGRVDSCSASHPGGQGSIPSQTEVEIFKC